MFTTENITLFTPFDYLLLKAIAALQGKGKQKKGGGKQKELNDDSKISKKLKRKKNRKGRRGKILFANGVPS